jgi:hypothetical protein
MSREQTSRPAIWRFRQIGHLGESQRAAVALRLANLPNGVRADRSCANLRTVPPISQPEAADMLQVSRRSVQTAARIERDAPPEVFQAVQSGAMSLNLAAAVAELPEEEREVVAAAPVADIKETASRQAVAKPVATDKAMVAGKVAALAMVPAAMASSSVSDHRGKVETMVGAGGAKAQGEVQALAMVSAARDQAQRCFQADAILPAGSLASRMH